ncbi:MAG: WGR domain-containing protein [Candidatus Eremiobacterota bacterium]
MRRFEFEEGNSSKFWEIELEGDSFTVRYGRLGTQGQTQTRTLDDDARALKEYDKLVAEKLKKGYREVGASAAAAPSPAPRPAAAKEDPEVRRLWDRAEKCLKAHHRKHYAALNKGATEAQIAKLEKEIGAALPDDFKASLRIHNGQDSDGPWVLRGWELLSCARIADEWGVWNDLYPDDFEDCEGEPDSPRVKNHWWHPRWIPITYNGGGDHHCLDLDPTPQGQVGQVIQMWHDDSPRTLEGSSFRDWFSRFVDDLEAGEAYDEDEEDDDEEELEEGCRRFEFVEGTSSKFWEISLEGDSFTVRYGRIGTDGQTQTRCFDTEEKARKEHDKLVEEKLKKGYVET